MENGPQIRTVGSASPEQKEQAVRGFAELLFDHFESLSPEEQRQLKKSEYEKSPTVLALIDFANKETSRLMNEAGIDPYNIPVENYHIVPHELYKKAAEAGTNAATFTTKQGILFNAESFHGSPLHFASVVLHETLHLKAHLSLEVTDNNGGYNTTTYRRGVKAGSSQKQEAATGWHEHFKGLDEAIVSTQEQRSLAGLLNLPEFSEEKAWLSSEKGGMLRKKLFQVKGVSENDVIWVDEKDYKIVSYPAQRQVLSYVCDEIQKQFPEQYRDTDEVFREFLKAHFTGQLLPIARLVEKTFGEGSFRLLGNVGTEKSSAIMHLESLKKARGCK